MFKFSNTSKRMILGILLVSLLTIVISAIYFRTITGTISFAKGIFLGSFATILKVIYTEKSIEKAMVMTSTEAQNNFTLGFVVRFIFTAIVLVISGVLDSVNILGTVVGLIVLQPIAYVVGSMKSTT